MSSTQLQTGLQAFLQQSMENTFNCLVTIQTNPAPQTVMVQPHIVSLTPLSVIPNATKSEEHMGSIQSQPPPTIKKELANVKGSSTIASQSLQAVPSQLQVLSSTHVFLEFTTYTQQPSQCEICFTGLLCKGMNNTL